jgi:hypothetical protein
MSVFGAAIAVPGQAADDAAIRKCRDLRDPTARLACYDALPLGTPAPAGSSPFRSQVPPPAPAPAPARPPQAAAVPAPAPLGTRESQFGLPARAGDELKAVHSHIPGRFQGWGPNYRIRLANGQVWQIADDSKAFMDRQDPPVTIRRGALGSFHMDFEGDNRSPRVRRVQ